MKYTPNENQLKKQIKTNFNRLLSTKGKKPIDIYSSHPKIQKSEVSGWTNGTKLVTPLKANLLKEIEWMSDISITFLMGYDAFMTEEERSLYRSNEANEIQFGIDSVSMAAIHLLRASGYSVKTAYEDGLSHSKDGTYDAETLINELKNYCVISKDGKAITFDLGRFRNFAFMIRDFSDMALSGMMKII